MRRAQLVTMMSTMNVLKHLLVLLAAYPTLANVEAENVKMGIDCSFPIHSKKLGTKNCGGLVGRQQIYEDYMKGCRNYFKGDSCDTVENTRIGMNNRQPQSMVNFTSTGFKKVKAPESLRKLLTEFWENNKGDMMVLEEWFKGNTYANHWKAPTYMVNVEDPENEGGGEELKGAIWDAAKKGIEEWTGMEQVASSVYGIRVYTEGAILNPHVDRMPLVSSAIFNVAQDLDEDWPLEVIDRDGNAVNITMEPGDLVLYESGSLIHGRPYELRGSFFANVFVHFQPVGYVDGRPFVNDVDKSLPPYLLSGSPAEDDFRYEYPSGYKPPPPTPDFSLACHEAAFQGDLEKIKKIAANDPRALHYADENGWQPIHEAVSGNNIEVIDFLLKHNADINSRVFRGASPLTVAINMHGVDHPVAKYLTAIGAKYMDNDIEEDEDEDDDDWYGAENEEGYEDEEQEDGDDPEEQDGDDPDEENGDDPEEQDGGDDPEEEDVDDAPEEEEL